MKTTAIFNQQRKNTEQTEMKINKNQYPTILTGLFVILSTLFIYNPMYAYQEGLQIFMLTSDYLKDTMLRPGGFSDYVGSFVLQFFMYPVPTVLILTAMICSLQMMLNKVFVKNGADNNQAKILSVIAAGVFYMPLTEVNIIFNGIFAIYLSVVLLRLSYLTENKIILSLLTIAVYWLTGGWGTVIYIVSTTIRFFDTKVWKLLTVNSLILVISSLLTKYIMQNDSLRNVFEGVDFNRFQDKPAVIWYVMIMTFVIIFVTSKLKFLFSNFKVSYGILIVGLGLILGSMIMRYDSENMLFYKIDRMVRLKQWGLIISECDSREIRHPLTMCYLNLALNEKGLLLNKMFNYSQSGSEGLASSKIDSQKKIIVNSEIYFRLGMANTAERLAIDAMECCNTFQKSGRQYKRLAEVAIIQGNKPLAIRYLKKLESTTFYRKWAMRAEEYIKNPTKVEPLNEWKIKPLEFQYDFFFSSENTTDLFYYMLANNQDNAKLNCYYIANLLLNKDVERLNKFLGNNFDEYQQLTHIYEYKYIQIMEDKSNQAKQELNKNDNTTLKFKAFLNGMTSKESDKDEKLKAMFGDTYWYYYYCR